MDKKPIHLLLIEDDQDDIFLMTKSLDLAGQDETYFFKLSKRNSLDQGLQSLAQEKKFDLVLLDLNLPDSRGLETFRLFHEKAPEVPVIVLSGTDDTSIALEAVRKGAEDYLVKPKILDGHLLIRSILYAMERHRIKSELALVTEELKNANSKLEKLALVDPLTGLLNRRGLQQILINFNNTKIRRKEADHVIILLDLDNFKTINDSLGHVAGDIVLKELSQKLRNCIRNNDYIARVGGDEFIIILPHTRFSHGVLVAEKIRVTIGETRIVFASGPIKITASLGVTAASPDMSSPEELLSKTQFILKKSKQDGKNRISCDDKLQMEETDKDLLSKIVNRLQSGQLIRIVKQPIYDLPEHKIVGYEFLTRLIIGDFQMADEFFQLCMEANLLTLVDHHCYTNSIEASRKTPDMDCHINLFPSTILAVGADRLIWDILGSEKGTRYCLELSEKQIIGNPTYLLDSVRAFRKANIQVGIDDVGFGNSCLESLVYLEPDFIKIDRKCLMGIDTDPQVLESFQRFLNVAKGLHVKVIAEGIEKEEELKLLVKLGVQFGQGYFLGRPA